MGRWRVTLVYIRRRFWDLRTTIFLLTLTVSEKIPGKFRSTPGRSIRSRCQDSGGGGGSRTSRLRVYDFAQRSPAREIIVPPHTPNLLCAWATSNIPPTLYGGPAQFFVCRTFPSPPAVFNLLRFSHPFVLLFCFPLVRRLSLPVISHTVAARSGPSVSCAGPRTFWLSAKRYAAPSRQVLNSPPFSQLFTPSGLYQLFWGHNYLDLVGTFFPLFFSSVVRG